MTRVSFAAAFSESFGSRRCEMKMALQSEWFRMLSTSLCEESGRMGTVTRPKGTQENMATVQLGMFWDRIATLSPALIP